MDSIDRAVQTNQTFAVIDRHASSHTGCPAPYLLDIVRGEGSRQAETWCDPYPEEATLVRKTLLTLAVDACHRHIPWVVLEIEETGSTPILRTLSLRPILGQRSVHVQAQTL